VRKKGLEERCDGTMNNDNRHYGVNRMMVCNSFLVCFLVQSSLASFADTNKHHARSLILSRFSYTCTKGGFIQ